MGVSLFRFEFVSAVISKGFDACLSWYYTEYSVKEAAFFTWICISNLCFVFCFSFFIDVVVVVVLIIIGKTAICLLYFYSWICRPNPSKKGCRKEIFSKALN